MNSSPETTAILASGIGALLFAATFLWGDRFHPLKALFKDRRSLISFAAGTAVAYVFVHLMPELADLHRDLVSLENMELRFEGMEIYLLAMIGFLVFFSLENMRRRQKLRSESEDEALDFKIHVGGFAVYVCLVSYILVQDVEELGSALPLFVISMALHFLSVAHTLYEEHGTDYERSARWILAGVALLGWTVGLVFSLPQLVSAMLVAFISGAIVMNSVIAELPSEKDGRFLPFLAGGIIYSLILLPLG